MKLNMKDFDGLYFTPGEEDTDLTISYFRFDDDRNNATPVEGTDTGDKYHIAFFKYNENDEFVFDDTFEAIFSDPITYVKTLAGLNLFGCILRKTEKSQKWFDEYVQTAVNVTMGTKNA